MLLSGRLGKCTAVVLGALLLLQACCTSGLCSWSRPAARTSGSSSSSASRPAHPPLRALPATAAPDPPRGSAGIEAATAFLNTPASQRLLVRLAELDPSLAAEMQGANFWSGGSAVVTFATCTAISARGLELDLTLRLRGRESARRVTALFPRPVPDEVQLKLVLIDMAISVGLAGETAAIASLPFGCDASMPVDFLFNNVPHAPWVRSYLYRFVCVCL